MFIAANARANAKHAKEQDWTYDRRYLMEKIKEMTEIGEFKLNLGHLDHYVLLIEDDYIFFEKLGYTVKREERKAFVSLDKNENIQYYSEPAVISW